MKKKTDPEILDEYDFAKGIRGKYVERYKESSNIVKLDGYVAAFSPDTDEITQYRGCSMQICNVLRSKRWLQNFVLFICTGCLMTCAFGAEPAPPQSQSPNLRSLAMTLGTKTILAKVADNDSSRIQGLLGWTNINDETGMLLDFIYEGNYAIHMQGMKFPIDAIWIDSRGAIRLIYDDIQPNSGQVYPSMFPCRYCLEVKAGFCKKFGVKIGQSVNFGGEAK